MNAGPILILGTGDQASVYAHTAQAAGIPIAGFLGRTNRRAPAELYVEGDSTDSMAIRNAANHLNVTCCIAAFGDNNARQEASDAAIVAGLELATLVHPTAVIDVTAQVADGVFVAQGAQITCNVRLDRGALVNSAAIIEHDCIIGAFAAVYSGAVLGGCVTLARRAAVGLGAVVLPGRAIGEDCVIGAGAVVTRDQPARTVVMGMPGKVQRSRAPNEPYVS